MDSILQQVGTKNLIQVLFHIHVLNHAVILTLQINPTLKTINPCLYNTCEIGSSSCHQKVCPVREQLQHSYVWPGFA